MPVYTYKAKKADGEAVHGELQAESEKAAVDALYRQGIFPLEVRGRGENGRSIARRAGEKAAAARSRRAPKPEDVAVFMRQLADLLRAGVALHQALTTLERQTSNERLSKGIDAVADDVRAGKALHEAMAKHTHIFPPLFSSMVKAGETGGFLEDVLFRLAEFVEKDSDLKGRIRAALAYPILLIVLGTGAVAFLMTFFIPRFSQMFRDLGSNLPPTTEIVISISNFMKEYWVVPLGVLIFVILLYKRFVSTPRGRRTVDGIKVSIPLFGDVIRKSAIARFTRTLGTMLRSGVPILSALEISKEAMGNRALMDDIEEAGAGVTQGRTLADMLRGSRFIPQMVVDMVAVGEEGGNLDEVLVNIADSYDRHVDRAVRVFIALFEPILLVVMACIVGFIVISMLLPVFTLSTIVK